MGSDSRKLKAIARRFRECAAQIDSISSAIVGQIFRKADIPLPYQLPTGLREFAALTEFIAPLQWQTYWTVAKKQLIHYVKQKTGHYNDEWVAELIATATDRDDYDPKTHGGGVAESRVGEPSASTTTRFGRVCVDGEAPHENDLFGMHLRPTRDIISSRRVSFLQTFH